MYSAIIEHTNQVIYLEDNDVASVNSNGQLTIHRIRQSYDDPNASAVREVITLKMEIQQIMKGKLFYNSDKIKDVNIPISLRLSHDVFTDESRENVIHVQI